MASQLQTGKVRESEDPPSWVVMGLKRLTQNAGVAGQKDPDFPSPEQIESSGEVVSNFLFLPIRIQLGIRRDSFLLFKICI
jgi:hypothetical protein